MNRKIKERLDSLDLKSLFLTIAFFTIAIVLFFFFTGIRDRLRTSEEEKFQGRAKGQIISIEQYDRIAQSKWKGTRISVDSYKIVYRYKVMGQIFESIDIIPATTKNQNLINHILNNGVNSICFVKFDIPDPKKSILVENE